jgi:hypothetical protein
MITPELTKFEMNRMCHARAQELHLMGSPAGVNGHPQLSQAAQRCFGAKSWSDLNVDQMRQVYEFLDSRKRMPMRGELSK